MAAWSPVGFSPAEQVDLRQCSVIEVGSETAMLKAVTTTVAAGADGVAAFATATKPCFASGRTSGRRYFSLKD